MWGPQRHLEKKKMKQVCFWLSPLILFTLQLWHWGRDCEVINPSYDFVGFQTKWASTPPILNRLRSETNYELMIIMIP